MGSCGQGLPVSRHSSSQQGVTMGKGQNEGEGGFSEEQIQMYKDCFKLMDINKDGTLDKNDLRGAFDNIGVLMSESELDDLMGEVGGPCTFQGMVDMFQSKLAGDGNDPDKEGKIDVKMFQHALRTWGDKMTNAEIDDIFNEFDVVHALPRDDAARCAALVVGGGRQGAHLDRLQHLARLVSGKR